VTPTQAEQLALAASQTSIQLVLRNPLDHEIAKTPGTALQRLFSGNNSAPPQHQSESKPKGQAAPRREPARIAPPPIIAAAPKEPPFVMEIISGKDKREQRFVTTTPPEVK